MSVDNRALAEPIEVRGSGHGVSAHRFVDKPVTDIQFRKHDILANTIDRIAGGTPDARIEGRFVDLLAIGKLAISQQNLRLGIDVIKCDAIKAPVHSVIDIVHEHRVIVRRHFLLFLAFTREQTAGSDTNCKSVRSGNVVATGLSDHAHAGIKVLIDDRTQDISDSTKGNTSRLCSREATTD